MDDIIRDSNGNTITTGDKVKFMSRIDMITKEGTITKMSGGSFGIKDKDPDFERNQLLKKWNLRLIFKIYSVKINSKIIENKIWVRETDPEFSDIIFKAYTSFKYIMKNL